MWVGQKSIFNCSPSLANQWLIQSSCILKKKHDFQLFRSLLCSLSLLCEYWVKLLFFHNLKPNFLFRSIPVQSLPPLEWPLSSHSGSYELQIEVQPKPHHRAHYETEGSRGAVKAPTGGHPVVQVRCILCGIFYNAVGIWIPERQGCFNPAWANSPCQSATP